MGTGGDARGTQIRVVLVDDERLIRAGLRMLMDVEEHIDVVGEASNGREAVEICSVVLPDVVVMDLRMPIMDGTEATRQLTSDRFEQESGTPPAILVLTTFNDDDAVRSSLRAGASGFILKNSAPVVLADAIAALAAGDGWLDPSVTRGLLQDFADRPDPHMPTPVELEQLTRREREVLVQLAHGRSNTQIAGELFLSEATVKTHIHRIFLKLGLTDRAQAVSVAFRTGLVRSGRPAGESASATRPSDDP
jgi:DNA-binding NarL/FixJ family response regulator